jgi:hypothetical protein
MQEPEYNSRPMTSRACIAATFLCAILCGSPVEAQIPIRDFQEIEGPWECTDASGVQGIFITGSTRLTEVAKQEKVAWQTVSIFVYSHRGSEQKGGYFALGHDDSRGSIRFDGKHLAIPSIGSPTASSPPHLSAFDLDLTFDPKGKRWDGSWSMCRTEGGVILERPHPNEGIQRSFLVGDWDGRPTSNGYPFLDSSSLHFRQGTDGTLSFWFDLVQRSSLPAERIVSFEIVHSVSQGFVVTPRESNFVVRLAYPGEYQFRYEGVVSPDGKRMSGQWYNESSGGIVTDLNTPSLPPGFPTVYERRD